MRPSLLRRDPQDRAILQLALPALGALAAEPLYILVDTAIVGHLGTSQLAALALAATVLGSATALCNFLAYGTAAVVSRLHGAGAHERTAVLAVQVLWLSIAVGIVVAALCAAFAAPMMTLVGGGGHTADLAARYVRIASIGLPAAMIALGAQGWLRGVGRVRVAMVVLIAANAANVAIELVLVYGLHLGLDGSALGTVIAQAGMGAAFVALLVAAARAGHASVRPDTVALRSLARIGADIAVRTAALLGAFVLASAVCARISAAALGAHQIAFQLFIFLALVLDAIAIAGEVLAGQRLGAHDRDGAIAAARRTLDWSLVAGLVFAAVLLAGIDVIPRAFTDDPAVLHQAHELWPLFAVLMIPGAVVFALDGILFGAGDSRYVAAAMLVAFLAFAPLALLTLHQHWGIVGVWVALNVLMAVRLIGMGARFSGGRWAVVGAG